MPISNQSNCIIITSTCPPGNGNISFGGYCRSLSIHFWVLSSSFSRSPPDNIVIPSGGSREISHCRHWKRIWISKSRSLDLWTVHATDYVVYSSGIDPTWSVAKEMNCCYIDALRTCLLLAFPFWAFVHTRTITFIVCCFLRMPPLLNLSSSGRCISLLPHS